MPGSVADIFVGVVSIVLGLTSLVSSIANWESVYQLRKTRWLEVRLGRSGVRIFLAVLGLSLIILGIAVALGFSPNATE